MRKKKTPRRVSRHSLLRMKALWMSLAFVWDYCYDTNAEERTETLEINGIVENIAAMEDVSDVCYGSYKVLNADGTFSAYQEMETEKQTFTGELYTTWTYDYDLNDYSFVLDSSSVILGAVLSWTDRDGNEKISGMKAEENFFDNSPDELVWGVGPYSVEPYGGTMGYKRYEGMPGGSIQGLKFILLNTDNSITYVDAQLTDEDGNNTSLYATKVINDGQTDANGDFYGFYLDSAYIDRDDIHIEGHINIPAVENLYYDINRVRLAGVDLLNYAVYYDEAGNVVDNPVTGANTRMVIDAPRDETTRSVGLLQVRMYPYKDPGFTDLSEEYGGKLFTYTIYADAKPTCDNGQLSISSDTLTLDDFLNSYRQGIEILDANGNPAIYYTRTRKSDNSVTNTYVKNVSDSSETMFMDLLFDKNGNFEGNWDAVYAYQTTNYVYNYTLFPSSGTYNITLRASGYKPVHLTVEKPEEEPEPTTTLKKQTINGVKSSYAKAMGKTVTLNARTSGNGKISYKSSNTKIAKVTSKGKVTFVKPGQTKITITAAKTATYSKATKSVTIKVKPKKVTLKSAKSNAKKKIPLKWKKGSGITKYQISYSTNKNFKKSKTKTVTVAKDKKSKTIKGLKSGKKYYIRMRAYKKTSSGKVYGNYSKVKKVSVK